MSTQNTVTAQAADHRTTDREREMTHWLIVDVDTMRPVISYEPHELADAEDRAADMNAKAGYCRYVVESNSGSAAARAGGYSGSMATKVTSARK